LGIGRKPARTRKFVAHGARSNIKYVEQFDSCIMGKRNLSLKEITSKLGINHSRLISNVISKLEDIWTKFIEG
jgi:hypothetical protein